MSETFMAAETAETGAAARRQLAANARATGELAAALRLRNPPFVATIARGSSDHAALFLKHVVRYPDIGREAPLTSGLFTAVVFNAG